MSKREFLIPLELEDFFVECPILSRSVVQRVHMQVVLVWAFYNHPDISNDELSELIRTKFPESSWDNDAAGRAIVDRRKYNNGLFRCMGGWKPEDENDPHYAKDPTPTVAS